MCTSCPWACVCKQDAEMDAYIFTDRGCIPQAHIALFQKLFLEDNLNWMSTGLFMELFALGQCLPGPTSTQVLSPPAPALSLL